MTLFQNLETKSCFELKMLMVVIIITRIQYRLINIDLIISG